MTETSGKNYHAALAGDGQGGRLDYGPAPEVVEKLTEGHRIIEEARNPDQMAILTVTQVMRTLRDTALADRESLERHGHALHPMFIEMAVALEKGECLIQELLAHVRVLNMKGYEVRERGSRR